MIHIRKATIEDIASIAIIGRSTFLDTYLPNTPKEAVVSFVAKAFDIETLTAEFDNTNIHYYVVFVDETLAGYSKIELNVPNETVEATPITKLDRLYVLKEFHGQNIGAQLFQHTIEASKKAAQQGMWLYVLITNERALHFYLKHHFKITGEYDFKISETRYNPNYVMHLSY